MRSTKEIEDKIKSVEKEYSKLPEYSTFGDPNWKMRDATIEILKRAKAGEISDLECGDFVEQNLDLAHEDNNAVMISRCDTYDWLCGQTDEL